MACSRLTSSAQKCERLVHIHLHHRFASSLQRWQRRCDRLTQLQQRIRFPPLETLCVEGQSLQLPLSAAGPSRSPSQEELEYLVGFFDGDGCVTMQKSTGRICLCISQNIDSAAVLVHFRALLGGGVTRHRQATGSSKATLGWQVWGPDMVGAAAVLSSIQSMKQAQLRIAAMGRVRQAEREKVEKELQSLKQPNHAPHFWGECSWPYLAGFFDAEGSITVQPTKASLQLRLAQLNPYVLAQLHHFLHQNALERWSLYHNETRCSELVCYDLEVCKQTLELLLAHGMRVKRRQAKLALTLTRENHLKIRETMFSLKGLQNRYRRLNEDGIERAKEIERLNRRAQRHSGPEFLSMQQQLEELRAEHKLENLVSRCSLLREDMRRALREGGQVIPQGHQPF